jgi:translocator protein
VHPHLRVCRHHWFYLYQEFPLNWYTSLNKPEFTPPGWVISTVWIVLFALMGISLFLIWREGFERSEVKSAIYIFVAQLIVNVLWSGAFFGLRSPLAGMIVIIILWGFILLTVMKFWPISGASALLLVPYILWVSFAAFLNFTFWRLNP